MQSVIAVAFEHGITCCRAMCLGFLGCMGPTCAILSIGTGIGIRSASR